MGLPPRLAESAARGKALRTGSWASACAPHARESRCASASDHAIISILCENDPTRVLTLARGHVRRTDARGHGGEQHTSPSVEIRGGLDRRVCLCVCDD